MKIAAFFVIGLAAPSCLAHDLRLHDTVPDSSSMPSLSGDPSADRVEQALSKARAHAARAVEAGVSAKDLDSASAVYANAVLWMPAKLRVCFWDGDKDTREAVEKFADAWSDAANILLSFRSDGSYRQCTGPSSADIRVAFGPSGKHSYVAGQDPYGNWSQIGRLSRSGSDVSLNLYNVPGSLAIGANDDAAFLVRHEFGHALGVMHEHQRAECNEWFDLETMASDLNWTLQQVKDNVGIFSSQETRAFGLRTPTPYDIKSVMQYNFSPRWYKKLAGRTNPCERKERISELSSYDIAGIRAMYGVPLASPRQSPGIETSGVKGGDGNNADLVSERGRDLETPASAPASPEETVRQRETREARSSLERSQTQLARDAAILAAQHSFASNTGGDDGTATTSSMAPVDPAAVRGLSISLERRAKALKDLILSLDALSNHK